MIRNLTRRPLEKPGLLHSPHCETGNKPVKEKSVNDCHGYACEKRTGHQRPPLEDVAAHELLGQSACCFPNLFSASLTTSDRSSTLGSN